MNRTVLAVTIWRMLPEHPRARAHQIRRELETLGHVTTLRSVQRILGLMYHAGLVKRAGKGEGGYGYGWGRA